MGHDGFSPIWTVRQPSVKFRTCFILLAPLLNLSFTPNMANNCDIRTLDQNAMSCFKHRVLKENIAPGRPKAIILFLCSFLLFLTEASGGFSC